MSTYTSSLGLEQITPGDQAGLWGNTTNNNLALIDQAVTGVTPISFAALSGTTYTLTDFDGAVDEARSAVLNITGIASGPNTVIVPNKQKTYLVRNATGQDVTFRTATPGQTYAVGAGNSILIFCDGNNGVFTGIASPSLGTLGVAAGGTGQTSFAGGGFVKSSGGTNALTASATVDLASEVSGVLPVARGGSGAGTFTTGSLLVGNGTGNFGTLVGGSAGQVATWNGSTWTATTPTTGAVTSVFGRTGAVTAQSGDYSSFYYPLSTNPAGYVTSSSLSGYATLSGTNTFTGNNSFNNVTVSGGTPVTIGTSTPAGQGINSGAYNFTAGTSIYRNNGGGGEIVIANGSGQFVFETNGNLTISGSSATKASGTTWSNPSDVRLKDNIQNYTDGLNKLTQIQPKTWSYNGKGGTQAGTRGLGVVADEIQRILPNTVSVYKAKLNPTDADKTDIKQFDATEITWLLVNSVKELKAELDAAKAEIAALKAK